MSTHKTFLPDITVDKCNCYSLGRLGDLFSANKLFCPVDYFLGSLANNAAGVLSVEEIFMTIAVMRVKLMMTIQCAFLFIMAIANVWSPTSPKPAITSYT